ncbi:MAG: hypothetical protein IPO21_00120 [Bacteroidales bacterium]|nr:hypothetical protein [Bacteroidales bacterium]
MKKREEYSTGKKLGLSVEYDENGNVIAEGSYVEDFKDGSWNIVVGDNTEKGIYKMGEKHGQWKHFYPTGEQRFVGNFTLGKENGKHKYFYSNGSEQLVSNYKSGKRVGKWIFYKETGEPYLMIFYKNNIETKIVTVQ